MIWEIEKRLTEKEKDNEKEKKNYFKEFRDEVYSNKYTTFIYIFLILLTNLGPIMDGIDRISIRFVEKGISDEELKIESLELSRDIFEFIKERRLNEPEIDFDDWEESTEEYLLYTTETGQLYNTRFGKKLAIVREEYAKRGIFDKEFERHYKNPTNYFGMTDVASRLSAMTTYLE